MQQCFQIGSLTILIICFFSSALAFAKDKLVYTYGNDKLYEVSSGKFAIADSSGNRSKIGFIIKPPYSFSDLDKEAVRNGLSYYGKLVANCDSHYFKYDGSDGRVPFNDLNIVQGTDMVWAVAIYPLSEADRLNGIEWRGKFVVGLVGSLRRYYLRSPTPTWSTWKTDDYIDDYMGRTQKVNGKWEYAESRSDGQNRPITCSDLPPDTISKK